MIRYHDKSSGLLISKGMKKSKSEAFLSPSINQLFLYTS